MYSGHNINEDMCAQRGQNKCIHGIYIFYLYLFGCKKYYKAMWYKGTHVYGTKLYGTQV